MREPQRRSSWRLVIAVGLMLAAILAYVASLDESDPEALPDAAEQFDAGPR